MGIDNIDIPPGIRQGIEDRNDPCQNEDRPPVRDNGKRLSDQERLENIEDRRADRKLREEYAGKAFEFAWCGFGFWVIVIIFYVFFFLCSGKKVISDAVLIAITSATTVNLFAAFVGVIRGLFPPVSKKK